MGEQLPPAPPGAETLLLRHARVLVTMDDTRREIEGGALYARGGRIEAVGTTAELAAAGFDRADTVIDAHDEVVLPGLVNTHHHLYQTLTRTLGADRELFGWLRTLYPVWARLRPEHLHVSTQLGLAELLLSGCTTVADHLYLFPNGCTLDDTVHAAATMGVRLHAARGAMSVGESAGGLPPDEVVEAEASILADTQRVIERFHDAAPGAFVRIVVAPCSPFSVSPGLMRDAAALARSFGAAQGVRLHTHLAENAHDVAYTRERFGCTPAQYAEGLGWLGPDVWHAHGVMLDEAGIAAFAASGTGVAHCPGSNMRLGSGIAPVRALLDAGAPVGLAVDGSASNDSGHLLAEARLALLLQRVANGADRFAVREALELATRGGAAVLGRGDLGVLAPGYAADFAAFGLSGLAHAGAEHDPVAALLLCQPGRASTVVCGGRVLVRHTALQRVDEAALAARHRTLARALLAG
jgi:cytosine/adenosine deaminase-related metal-dependent hydrolase